MMSNPTQSEAPAPTTDERSSILSDVRGGGFVEKMLILVLFVVVVMAGIQAIGTTTQSKLEEVNGQLQGAGGGGGGGEGGAPPAPGGTP